MVETRLSLSRFGLQMFWVRLAISGPQKETNENTLFINDLSATSPMRPPFLFFFFLWDFVYEKSWTRLFTGRK